MNHFTDMFSEYGKLGNSLKMLKNLKQRVKKQVLPGNSVFWGNICFYEESTIKQNSSSNRA
jgi:hypothetical protein